MNHEHKFPLITGQISLDLVNTEVVRHGTRYDLLASTEDVIAWVVTLQEQNTLYARQFSANVNEWADEALPLLKEVRLFLRQGYEQMANDQTLADNWVNHLEFLIKKAPFSYHIVDGALLPVPNGNSVDSLVALIAFNAINLFVTNELTNIHRCANPDCVLLFMDKKGRRKWCSMKICGNRNKVTRHQRRKEKGQQK
ncbi:CGNR zinc finger domain-containing protein [Alkalihalobacterium alkalinitrilicum]|uniref:CGNR zinc finger domain-containing protein n=1 Tax=Alkalihalobacterium alkalinitrilicum TaxID=427920 RepID=UPI000994D3FF|nr:CGNR zinc finger domain-containing protein [Alkalihalobacterium alkalinitrilicum]